MHRAGWHLSCVVAVSLLLAAGSTVQVCDAANAKKVDKLARECASGKAASCTKLADIARQDGSAEIRRLAVEGLSDGGVLARIAEGDQSWEVRLAAVDRIDDQLVLARVARTDASAEVRTAAVGRLDDQPALAEVAAADSVPAVRTAAVQRLEDEPLLVGLATTSDDPDVWQAAIAKVSPDALKEIAVGSEGPERRAAAVAALEDQSLLGTIVDDGRFVDARAAAAAKLEDQSLLERIARGADEAVLRQAAMGRLEPAALTAIASTHEDAEVRAAAVATLDDETALAEVALHGGYLDERCTAASRLTDPNHLEAVMRADADDAVRWAAAAKAAGRVPLRPAASYWEYGSLCDPEVPPDFMRAMTALSDVTVSLEDCKVLGREWGRPAGLRLHMDNRTGREATVVLPPLDSIVLGVEGRHQPALGLLLWSIEGPDAKGKVSPQAEFTGELGFPIAAGEALDLVFFFAEARSGDVLTFGDLPPVAVSGKPGKIVPPQPARLTARASLWPGSACDKPPHRPSTITFSGSFSMEACGSGGQTVRLEVSNEGGREGTVALRGLDSIRLQRRAGGSSAATGVGLTMRNPMGSGTQTSLLTTVDGELGFPLGGGEVFDLLIVFPAAAVGDSVSITGGPSAVIRE